MVMRERIRQLREQTLAAVPRISAERALLLTEFLDSEAARGMSIPVQRASAFYHIMDKKKIYVGEGELIVGERGSAPAVVPTYPEVCLHSLEDLETLDTRSKIFYKVDDETKQIYRDRIIPFWKGRSQRERIFREMTPEWLDAYAAGMFTEFQEQRGPG
ncbi:TPA: formate C-acetyltransferase/glycerol dehydratase family glycyl radical enzyme, partial [Candidatus Sumerlaeota bacterium]|nr:formate C-acetyltransferase/glycerol dehydratase family glycyl radical enzyme [Candidatus Sumerlaeota bacterium]